MTGGALRQAVVEEPICLPQASVVQFFPKRAFRSMQQGAASEPPTELDRLQPRKGWRSANAPLAATPPATHR